MSASSVPVSKVKRGIYVCVTVVMMVLFAYCVFGTASFAAGVTPKVNTEEFQTGVSITDNGEKINFSYNGEKLTGDQYVVMMVEGTAKPDTISAENILYIDQQAATSTGVLFEIYPKAQKDSVVLLSGNIDDENKQVVVATLDYPEPTGYSISGTVVSYNPTNPITVTLYKDGVATQYRTTISAGTGSGEVTQNFAIDNVPSDTYDLVVEKIGHLKYTIRNININKPIELSNIIMKCGDVDNSGRIDFGDLSLVVDFRNYGLIKTEENENCDLDGSGRIDFTDLTMIVDFNSYGKSNIVLDYENNN